ncbi:hypothetical protein J3F83DRAFT_718567 [Trichoderma novae-zelandiae]
MCNYIYKELKCQHHYHLVESWCPKYIATERRCTPTIVSKQYWGDDICGMPHLLAVNANNPAITLGRSSSAGRQIEPLHKQQFLLDECTGNSKTAVKHNARLITF